MWDDSFVQKNHPSAFISTTRNRDYAIASAMNIADPFRSFQEDLWRTDSFYVYQIVPDRNFISVIDTYKKELALASKERSPNRFDTLVRLSSFYTNREEYVALGSIKSSHIVSATRYYFSVKDMNFIKGITQINPYFDKNIIAVVHPNNYPIGTLPDVNHLDKMIDENTCESQLQELQQQISMRKKRELYQFKSVCLSSVSKIKNKIEMPKDIFNKNALKIQVKAFHKYDYCLEPNKNYLYINYCNHSKYNNKWIYTELGQLIAEVNDGKNNQYYCLTATKESYADLKMKICDLNKTEQIWKLNELSNSKYTLVSYSGKTVGIKDNYYTYLIEEKNEINHSALIISNYSKIKNNISFPILQFSLVTNIQLVSNQKYLLSINLVAPNLFHSIYPTTKGYVMVDKLLNLNGYSNYYNAHNNTFFSNYGNEEGIQVCYYSSSGYVYNDYCSTQTNLENRFKWYFKKQETQDSYKILDAEEKILYINNADYYAYIGNSNRIHSDNFFQDFYLNLPIKIYALNYEYSQLLAQEQNISAKKHKKLFAFYSLYNYFNKLNKIKISHNQYNFEVLH